MNVDRGKTSFTEVEVGELQQRLMTFKHANGHSWPTIEKLTGIPHGTISQWGPGRYTGDNAALAERVHKFFLKEEAQRELFEDRPSVPNYIPTKTSKRITTLLRWAHLGEMALLVGDPGVGKTATMVQYAATTPNCWLVKVQPVTTSINALLLAVLRSMGVVRSTGAGHQLSALVRERVVGREALLMIDEAQLLSEGSIEQLRALHDDTGVGLVLCGNKDVQHRIERSSNGASFAQRHSRVSMRLVLSKPEPEDVGALLDAWDVREAKERTFLSDVAMLGGAGGLRAVTKTLKLATTLAHLADDEARVLDHLRAARAQIAASGLAA